MTLLSQFSSARAKNEKGVCLRISDSRKKKVRPLLLLRVSLTEKVHIQEFLHGQDKPEFQFQSV